MTHTSRVALRWSDLDALGHVNNAVYLTLCEQGRIEAFEALMPGGWVGTESPVLAAASVAFRRPILGTGDAVVATTFETPGRTSLKTRVSITLDGALRAEAEAVLVWVDVATGRPVPVPDALRQAIAAGTPDAGPSGASA